MTHGSPAPLFREENYRGVRWCEGRCLFEASLLVSQFNPLAPVLAEWTFVSNGAEGAATSKAMAQAIADEDTVATAVLQGVFSTISSGSSDVASASEGPYGFMRIVLGHWQNDYDAAEAHDCAARLQFGTSLTRTPT